LAKHGLIAASGLLMPSTPFAYPQVISRRFAYCRVVKMRISADQRHFRDGFDSRQLHRKSAGQSDNLEPGFIFISVQQPSVRPWGGASRVAVTGAGSIDAFQ
jgi:hypothetical protein